jgi:hypothetical protein
VQEVNTLSIPIFLVSSLLFSNSVIPPPLVTKTYGILDAFNRFMASTVLARTFPINELKEGIDILLKSNYESKKAVRKSRKQLIERTFSSSV